MPQELFQSYYDRLPVKPLLVFVEPGKERQDSVYNGFAVGSYKVASDIGLCG